MAINYALTMVQTSILLMFPSKQMKQLGEKGLEMIGDCSKHPEIRGCWAEIGKQKTFAAISFTFPLLHWLVSCINISVIHLNL